MRRASRIFWWAGVYGLIVVAPGYVLEAPYGRVWPPAITHPEFYYGFAGVTLAWQVLFLIIAGDPARYRPAMLAGVVEKLSYALSIFALLAVGRVPTSLAAFALIDFALGGLFLYAYRITPDWTLAMRRAASSSM